jgi:hypothetical protein
MTPATTIPQRASRGDDHCLENSHVTGLQHWRPDLVLLSTTDASWAALASAMAYDTTAAGPYSPTSISAQLASTTKHHTICHHHHSPPARTTHHSCHTTMTSHPQRLGAALPASMPPPPPRHRATLTDSSGICACASCVLLNASPAPCAPTSVHTSKCTQTSAPTPVPTCLSWPSSPPEGP